MVVPNDNIKIRYSPSGIHFYNPSSGLNILLDEITPSQDLWSLAPRHLSVALTNMCDLNCSFCYATKNNSELNFELLTKWICELDKNGCLSIGFGGGEPTLYKQLPELCDFVIKNTNLAITMTTHAHNIDRTVIGKLKDKLHFIRVSMDGTYKTYEKLRGKSFETLKEKLEMTKLIAPIGINYVVNSDTISDLDAALNFSEEIGAEEFLLLPEESTSKVNGIDNSTKRKLIKWVTANESRIPLTISENGCDGIQICNPFYLEKELKSYAHIDAEGILKKTSFDIKGIKINQMSILKALEKLEKLEKMGGI